MVLLGVFPGPFCPRSGGRAFLLQSGSLASLGFLIGCRRSEPHR
jgi:hypothetical protein